MTLLNRRSIKCNKVFASLKGSGYHLFDLNDQPTWGFFVVKLFSIFLFLSTFSAFAKTHEASIIKIDYGTKSGEETLLFLSDGYVIKVSQDKNIGSYEDLKQKKALVRFEVDEERWLESTKVLSFKKPRATNSFLVENYEPSVVTSEEASRIFINLRDNASRRSQCYNRAHVWAYESKNASGLDSMKVFIFFTRKYIREVNYHWWFHVAPFTYVVSEAGVIEEMVLDNNFTPAPTAMRTWTDIFMYNKVNCPVITKYSEYSTNQEAEYCYLQKSSMYYVQPLDLENLEISGKTKNVFVDYEIRRAYNNAFRGWR